MRSSRVFVDRALPADTDIQLDERSRHYVSQVLRLRPGDPLILFNGDGLDRAGEIRLIERQRCVVRLAQTLREEPGPSMQIHLGVGISRGERMDWVIQKSVELGVASITPLATARGTVKLRGDRLTKRRRHWRGVIVSACEQCGRSRLPTLNPLTPVAQWTAAQHNGLLLHHEASETISALAHPGESVSLLVGAEGGLSETEREAALHDGFTAVRLGPRIMRTETAPLAALAAIQALWGDFR